MIIERRSRSNLTFLDIEGAIRLGESAEFFSQTLENLLRNETTNIVIDFTRINYIDSTESASSLDTSPSSQERTGK